MTQKRELRPNDERIEINEFLTSKNSEVQDSDTN